MQRMTLAIALTATSILSTLAYAGAYGGPEELLGHFLPAGDYLEHQVTMVGGEEARIVLDGNGLENVDVYIFDEAGFLVATDTYDGEDQDFMFFVDETETYTVLIMNHGGEAVVFDLATN